MPRMAGQWKFNLLLLERLDFWEQLIRLFQWGRLLRFGDGRGLRIRFFTTEYTQQLALDKAKNVEIVDCTAIVSFWTQRYIDKTNGKSVFCS